MHRGRDVDGVERVEYVEGVPLPTGGGVWGGDCAVYRSLGCNVHDET